MKNIILKLTNTTNNFKNNKFFKPIHKFAKLLGLVKLFHRYRSNLKEIRFRLDILGANVAMIDRSPKFYYYYIYLNDHAYEPALTKKIHDLITEKENPVFVDIGAHLGYYSLLSASWHKGSNPVFAIEPNPDFFTTLIENIAINHLEHKIKPFQLALSNKTGKAKMTGWDSRVMNEDETGNVITTTFDLFCQKEGIEPDILKIDVHGAEGKILDGMQLTLKKVSHIFCETHHEILGFNVNDLIKKMTSGGLKVYLFTEHRKLDGGKIIPIEEANLANHDDLIIYGKRENR